MAVVRVHKTKDYTVMSNAHFREREMTLKAKGLLSLMLSLPEDWDYSIAGLVAICAEKESAIVSTLKELRKFGYLYVEKKMPNETESGRIEYTYHIFEQPNGALRQIMEKQEAEKQGVENLCLENQGVENPGQYNTDNKITKNKDTKKEDIKEKKKEKEKSVERVIKDYLQTVDESQREAVEALLFEWIKLRKAKRAVLTEKSLEMNLEKLQAFAYESGLALCDYLQEVIRRGWVAFYPIKSAHYAESYQQTRQSGGNIFLEIAKEKGIF